jgi:Ion channel
MSGPRSAARCSRPSLIAVLAGGAELAAVEKNDDLSAWDGVRWAIQTVTTAGYGDTPVTTDGGRVIAICLMITGTLFASKTAQ